MKQNARIILLLASVCMASGAYAQNKVPLTFTEAYQQMNQNSHVLKQVNFELKF